MNKDIELAVADLEHAFGMHYLKHQQLTAAQQRLECLEQEVSAASGAIRDARTNLEALLKGEKSADDYQGF